MTQIAEPRAGRATPETSAGPARISHWIDGRIVAGTSGREGPVYNPATGGSQPRGRLRQRRRGRPGRRGGRGGLPGLAGDVAGPPFRDPVPDPPAASTSTGATSPPC